MKITHLSEEVRTDDWRHMENNIRTHNTLPHELRRWLTSSWCNSSTLREISTAEKPSDSQRVHLLTKKIPHSQLRLTLALRPTFPMHTEITNETRLDFYIKQVLPHNSSIHDASCCKLPWASWAVSFLSLQSSLELFVSISLQIEEANKLLPYKYGASLLLF